ncbi:MAG: queuosine precursor transporter [Chlamydiales bacterium]
MNELLFSFHIFLVLGFAWGALKLGREALISWIALQAILANLFVIKQIELFGLGVTCSDVYAIGSMLGLNLLQEYFGKESATRATWISFFLMIFFAIMSGAHLLYLPSARDTSHPSFLAVLSQTPRLLLASLCTFFVVQRVDVHLFHLFQKLLPHSSLALRTGITLTLSQLLDTALFSFLGLYGIVSSVGTLLLFSFLIKLLIIFALLPALLFFKRRAHV